MRTLQVPDSREKLIKLIEEINSTAEVVQFESEGERLAVLMTPDQYDRLLRVRDDVFDRAREALEKVPEPGPDEDVEALERELNEVVEKIRQERYEQGQTTT